MDNYAAHKHPNVKRWLAGHPRIVVHFTPTHASCMNLVEIWFGIIERQAVHRGSFGSVKDLNARSAPSSPAGTNAPTPSCGPRQPNKSSPRPSADFKHGPLVLLVSALPRPEGLIGPRAPDRDAEP
jgi:hypothetical protein